MDSRGYNRTSNWYLGADCLGLVTNTSHGARRLVKKQKLSLCHQGFKKKTWHHPTDFHRVSLQSTIFTIKLVTKNKTKKTSQRVGQMLSLNCTNLQGVNKQKKQLRDANSIFKYITIYKIYLSFFIYFITSISFFPVFCCFPYFPHPKLLPLRSSLGGLHKVISWTRIFLP